MMKILITTDELKSVRNNDSIRNEWNVDEICIWGTDIDASLKLDKYKCDGKNEYTFFVPTVINTKNPLAYDGVNIALRILFRYLCGQKKGISVVLLGFETREAFLLHCSYPNVLKIPGVSYCLLNKELVASVEAEKPLQDRLLYKAYIENLGLTKPVSFRTTHSLTNEWSLYKWSNYMGFENSENGVELLYFDYIKAVEKINNVKGKLLKNNPNLLKRIEDLRRTEAKVLLIDDNVGWHKFFRKLFQTEKPASLKFEAIGNDFRKKDIEGVKREISDRIDEFVPDVILLDFRLVEDADADCKFEKISGAGILKELKGDFQNPGKSYGRQVLIFTATSKIENILHLKKLNADGYILKEKTEYYTTKEMTKDTISKMICDVSNAVVRAKFLIPLNEKIVKLESLSSDVGGDFQKIVGAELMSIRLITQNNELDEGILKLVYLDIFKVFECIKEYSGIVNYLNDFSLKILASKELLICSYEESSIEWNCKIGYVKSSEHHKYCKKKDLNFALCAIILFRLGYSEVDNTKWNNIRNVRNALVHGDNGKLKKMGLGLEVSTLKEYSLAMLDLINEILDSEKINEVEPIKFNKR